MATVTGTVEKQVDRLDLELKVKETYRRVAEEPHGHFHFETGRMLAERLGYPPVELDRIPAEAIDSFAGVGYHMDLADIRAGERVLDLGSGSGMDTFFAALKAGDTGHVFGVDMTDEQLRKAERLRVAAGFRTVSFHKAYAEDLPFDDASMDVVISNGVINLCADKRLVFLEVARVLRRGGRLAISDILTERELPETVTCNATLWAACIGGAMQRDSYRQALIEAGFRFVMARENPQYRFLSESARDACDTYGVKSMSLLALRE